MEDKFVEKKDLYCPNCKLYPDKVRVVFEWMGEDRVWNEETGRYDLENADYGDYKNYCDECNTELISKVQE